MGPEERALTKAYEIGGWGAVLLVGLIILLVFAGKWIIRREHQIDQLKEESLQTALADRAVLLQNNTALQAARLEDQRGCAREIQAITVQSNERLLEEIQKQRDALDRGAAAARDQAEANEAVSRVLMELRATLTEQGKAIAALQVELAKKGR